MSYTTSDLPIILETVYPASMQAVWSALTDHKEMLLWYFDNIPAFKAEVGFTTQFLIENEGRKFTHSWIVQEVEAGKRIKYGWTFSEYPGNSYTDFELSEEGEKVRLKLTVVVEEDFPTDIPEFQRESGIAGWTYFLEERLKAYLEKK